MRSETTLQFTPDVSLSDDAGDIVVARPRGSASRLTRPGTAMRSLIEMLRHGGMQRDALCTAALRAAGGAADADLARLYRVLGEIERKTFVRYRLELQGQALATLEPLAAPFRFEELQPGGTFRLSRFASLRRVDDCMVAECPLGHARVLMQDPRAVALFAKLATPHNAAQLAQATPGLDESAATAFLALLTNAKAAHSCAADGRIAEDDSVPLRQWEFHDLMFHSRSRRGRHDNPYAGTLRFRDELPPLPAVKPRLPATARRITLHQPDLRALEANDLPFSRVAEARRSLTTPGALPLSAARLGEFLYRTARVVQLLPVNPERGDVYEASRRPSASGGAMHEIELYLMLPRCDGIDPGLYHYDPLAHELEQVAELGPLQKRLLADGCGATLLNTSPDALITLAARFQRPAWKYQSMAYALTLKNAGALIQQMYLVATAMNLAPCALGGGDSDLFAAATGLDYFVETSVAEFMLSSR